MPIISYEEQLQLLIDDIILSSSKFCEAILPTLSHFFVSLEVQISSLIPILKYQSSISTIYHKKKPIILNVAVRLSRDHPFVYF